MASALLWLSLLGGSTLASALDTSNTPTIKRADAGNNTSSIPTATLNNTVFIGRSLPEFEQELFLGIKFADEPVRFTPSTLKTAYRANDSDNGVYHASTASGLQTSSGTVLYNATEYGYDCPGYGSDETELAEEGYARFDENCMNLNIIRPKREKEDELLPVMIWIFGGGWVQGATADPR